jgi:hypothetical protein
MPIEIRELEINATMADAKKQSSSSSAAEREMIIRDCVEQILLILKEKQEP